MATRDNKWETLLVEHGIRPTSNRITIVKTFVKMCYPLSLRELEEAIGTIDKSILSRTIGLFREKGMLHTIEGNQGVLLYELCHSKDGHLHDNDQHVHFFCTSCGKTVCLNDVPVPDVAVPKGYAKQAVSCLVKGLCPTCSLMRSTSTTRRPS